MDCWLLEWSPQYRAKKFLKFWRQTDKSKRLDVVRAFVINGLDLSELSPDDQSKLNASVKNLLFKIGVKWVKSGRHLNRFLSSNSTWLQATYSLPDMRNMEHSEKKVGRTKKSFEECCEKSKKRRVQNLINSTSAQEITKASEVVLRKMGKRDSATIFKDLSEASSSRGTEVKKVFKNRNSDCGSHLPLSPDEALAIMIDINLSKNQYQVIRQKIDSKCKDLFPSYEKVLNAKKKCYPTETEVTETYAKSQLQSLVDHTVERLWLSGDFEKYKLQSGEKHLEILIKWGCDGAQQSQYKQKFSSEGQKDDSLFSISMVPIQMNLSSGHEKTTIWQNSAPSSTRYCRPIKFVFAKETVELISQEVKLVEQEISNLCPTVININNLKLVVTPNFMLTMIDGKICTTLSSMTSSSQTCFICGAKPSELNNPSMIVNKVVDKKSLSFGMSPLHSWIRFMECILHIGYKLSIKCWQARGAENKGKVAEAKKNIQDRFRSELGLLVDMPTQHAGNTNDGNTARRFFRAAEKSSEITGVNQELIERFHIILETLGSGYAISESAFENYTTATRNLYLREYSWYTMPVSVHKVLFHGKDIISSCILPIGQLSEEAQEARNKDTRRFREMFTRKNSRLNTNTDLLNRLLVSSDPYIASIRHVPQRIRGAIPKDVYSLLSIDDLDKEVLTGEGDSD